MTQIAERNQSLWLLTASPLIWAAHLMLSYITVSIWCAKLAGPEKSLSEVRIAIIVYTLFALLGIGVIGLIGYRRHSYGQATLPHDADTPEDRHRFLGFSTLLLSGLSAVAVIYAALVVIFFGAVTDASRAAGFRCTHAGRLLVRAAATAGASGLLCAHDDAHGNSCGCGAAAGFRDRWRTFDPVAKFPSLFAPIPASLLELIVVWSWHAPDLHHAAPHHTAVLIIEQGMFLLTGLLVWLSAFGGDDRSNASRRGTGVVALLLTSMHMTLLGALLTLTPRPLYFHTGVFSSMAHLDDQHLGGSIMLIIGGISYLAGGLWLMIGLIKGTTFKPERES